MKTIAICTIIAAVGLFIPQRISAQAQDSIKIHLKDGNGHLIIGGKPKHLLPEVEAFLCNNSILTRISHYAGDVIVRFFNLNGEQMFTNRYNSEEEIIVIPLAGIIDDGHYILSIVLDNRVFEGEFDFDF